MFSSGSLGAGFVSPHLTASMLAQELSRKKNDGLGQGGSQGPAGASTTTPWSCRASGPRDLRAIAQCAKEQKWVLIHRRLSGAEGAQKFLWKQNEWSETLTHGHGKLFTRTGPCPLGSGKKDLEAVITRAARSHLGQVTEIADTEEGRHRVGETHHCSSRAAQSSVPEQSTAGRKD